MIPTVYPHSTADLPLLRRVFPALLLAAAALVFTVVFTVTGTASAQDAGNDGAAPADTGVAVADIRGADPEEVADRAIEAWLASSLEAASIRALASDPEAFCAALPTLLTAPPAGSDTRVNLDDRQERELAPDVVPEGVEQRRYTYSAVASDTLQVVEVVVERPLPDGAWRPVTVGFFRPDTGDGRAWLRTPWAAALFVLFTVLVTVDLLRGGRIRGWLREGVAVVRQHRRVVIGTLAALYALFALGAAIGAAAPDECGEAVLVLLDTALSNVGATQALESGNLAIAATVIFFQNFIVVTVSLLFGSALLLGVPAYLIAGFSFLVQGIPFGLLGGGGPLALLVVGVLLLLELTAYFLVVAGGGMLLGGIIRGGFTAIGPSLRKLVLMLPLAGLLLLIGAWYEAAVVLLGR